MHPWLMSLRPDILLAKTVARPQPYPASVAMAWMVDNGPEHKLEEKQSWIQGHGGGPPRPIPASTAAILERIRASRNRCYVYLVCHLVHYSARLKTKFIIYR